MMKNSQDLILALPPAVLRHALKTSGILLSERGADKQIYLYKASTETPVLLELGRLREETFRSVGLGTGKGYDLDGYDFYYEHLILWDDTQSCIIGSYRLLPCSESITPSEQQCSPALYTETIYQLSDAFKADYFPTTVEIGRVFIQKKYWGTKSLDYLWFGMAYYFDRKPELKYFICALSIPAAFSPYAKQLMVEFYSRAFPCDETLATAIYPYELNNKFTTSKFFNGLSELISEKSQFKFLRKHLSDFGYKFPMLYKNTEIFHRDGVKFLSFGHDKGFSSALDGLMLADTSKMRIKVKTRYTKELTPESVDVV
ncbi:MAG: GNAT family N-acetyltransferase [Sinobacterium sp.]|nr:GNAT family N-acetyltransferase [Sinobacterium sp.]